MSKIKSDILHNLFFELDDDELLSVYNSIKGYRTPLYRSKTILYKYVFAKGFTSINEFYRKNGITDSKKRRNLNNILLGRCKKPKTILRFCSLLHLSDAEIQKVLEENKK